MRHSHFAGGGGGRAGSACACFAATAWSICWSASASSANENSSPNPSEDATPDPHDITHTQLRPPPAKEHRRKGHEGETERQERRRGWAARRVGGVEVWAASQGRGRESNSRARSKWPLASLTRDDAPTVTLTALSPQLSPSSSPTVKATIRKWESYHLPIGSESVTSSRVPHLRQTSCAVVIVPGPAPHHGPKLSLRLCRSSAGSDPPTTALRWRSARPRAAP